MTELPGESQPSRINGFLDSVGQLLVTALEMVQTRLELVFTELQEGMESLVGLVLWLLSALLATVLGLLFGGLALVFVFWDSHRVLVAVLLMCMFLLLAAAATAASSRTGVPGVAASATPLGLVSVSVLTVEAVATKLPLLAALSKPVTTKVSPE